jgi:hypothetical protein
MRARPPVVHADDPDDRTSVRRLEFVEVRSTPVAAHPAPATMRRTRRAKGTAQAIAGADDPASVTSGQGVPAAASATPPWSLWGDVET